MKVSIELIDSLTGLAGIKIKDKQKEELVGQVGEIVKYFDMLSEVEVGNEEDEKYDTNLRKDEVNVNVILPQEKALSGSERIHNGYFVVERVIDKDGEA